MSQRAILDWFALLVQVPDTATFQDLCDGRILYNLLNHVFVEHFPSLEYQSPIKNFQMNLRTIAIIIDNLKTLYQDLPQIDALKIAKDNDIQEITKLVSVIVKLLIESEMAQTAIKQMNQEQIENIVNFISIHTEEEPTTSSDQQLLMKIDELEDENANLKQQLEHNHQVYLKMDKKNKNYEILLQHKEQEITEYKQQINQQSQDINVNHEDLIEKLKQQLNQQNKETKQVRDELEILRNTAQTLEQYKKQNAELQQQLTLRAKMDKQNEELRLNAQILKTQLELKETNISKLQNQIKQLTLQIQSDQDKLIQFDLQHEVLKQEFEDQIRLKNKELYTLKQQYLDCKQQLERVQCEVSQETVRSSCQQQASCYLDQDLNQIDDEYGFAPDQNIQELEKIHKQKEKLLEQKMKTLESQLSNLKENNRQYAKENSVLEERYKQAQNELAKAADQSYLMGRVNTEKQQNMLLCSIIDSLKDRILMQQSQFKESLKQVPKSIPKPNKPQALKVTNH